MALVLSVAFPVALLLTGLLKPRRDAVWLVVVAQSLVYLFLAPNVATRELPSGLVARYAWLQWWLVVLFVVPGTLAYLVLVRRIQPPADAPRRFELRPTGTIVLAGSSLGLAVGYLVVAFSRGLLYRRLGWEGLASAQLDLSLLEFAFYRTFLEAAPFLLAMLLFALRATPVGRPLRSALVGAFGLTLAAYGMHVLVNSRVGILLLVALLVSITVMTASARAARRPEIAVLLGAVVLVAYYGLRVVENVRVAITRGGSPFSVENLVLSGRTAGGGEEAYYWRLNGIDLMALSADVLEEDGPAYGGLWVVPALLALDPLVRTSTTEQLKRAALTNAKSFMLLRFAGISLPDYYSCIVTDSYGNFGRAGFLLVALVLAGLAALVARGILASHSPTMALLACFVAARMLPFEQEFATLLFSWPKLLPVLGLVLLARPLRPASVPAGS
jgi:hypothetical protein